MKRDYNEIYTFISSLAIIDYLAVHAHEYRKFLSTETHLEWISKLEPHQQMSLLI